MCTCIQLFELSIWIIIYVVLNKISVVKNLKTRREVLTAMDFGVNRE